MGAVLALRDARKSMKDPKPPDRARTEELLKALEREQEQARDLSKRHSEDVRTSHHRDQQVLIERRRQPR